ncbi:MAG TPA: glycosyltransferase family 4 protein, partial [Parapedobacter sp.]|nr:glycosyltransferase family 4 protein [Parapedobacter sp.]
YFLSSRVFVAPLRFGAGMKGKIGQSFEFGLPVITTDIGAEGMALINRKHYLRANTAEELAAAILELYNDGQLWNDLSKGGFEALAPYLPERVKDKLKLIL